MAEQQGGTPTRRWLIDESQAPGVYGLRLGAVTDWRAEGLPALYHLHAAAVLYGSLEELAEFARGLLEDIAAIRAGAEAAG